MANLVDTVVEAAVQFGAPEEKARVMAVKLALLRGLGAWEDIGVFEDAVDRSIGAAIEAMLQVGRERSTSTTNYDVGMSLIAAGMSVVATMSEDLPKEDKKEGIRLLLVPILTLYGTLLDAVDHELPVLRIVEAPHPEDDAPEPYEPDDAPEGIDIFKDIVNDVFKDGNNVSPAS